jgi:hypothetical protein
LTRSAEGVQTELQEDKKTFLRSFEIDVQPNFIPNKAKECMDHNSKQIEIAKVTLLISEKETTSSLELQYLEE